MRCSLSMYVYSSREQLWCRGQGAFLERCVFLHLLSYQSHDHLRSLFTFCACPCSQLMCVWALVTEITFVNKPQQVFAEVTKNWPKDDPISIVPGPVLTFPQFAWVPKNTNYFNEVGMSGWFSQDYNLFGTLNILGHSIELGAM